MSNRVSASLPARLLRGVYRVLTYSPLATWREQRTLVRTLRDWSGEHLFLFPYFGIGGAERVHADIVATVKDKAPLVIIHGFSGSDANRSAFERSAITIELPHLLNHPITRGWARTRIAAVLNERDNAVLFASLSSTFFDLLPALHARVKCTYLQHAFLFQPSGNAQHKAWLHLFPRLHAMLFVSRHALGEYRRFLSANGISPEEQGKLGFISNAVDRFVEPLLRKGRVGVLFVGRDSSEKRPELFLRICEQLHAAAPDGFRFTTVGINARSNSAGIRSTGPVSDPSVLSALYSSHDILVLTSDREGFPMVIMEAMAHGLAIVSTPVGDVPNRLDSGYCCIISSTDPSIVVNEMTDFLLTMQADPERLWAMRQAAFARAKVVFEPGAFHRHYRELLTSPAASTSAINR
ncbi:MAG: glycosyltransferase family 4 protein [Flavobacteriales bacterium]|nr:MAG: glycosyltransferase family 4 protein [Flavobacteriales bacterium]